MGWFGRLFGRKSKQPEEELPPEKPTPAPEGEAPEAAPAEEAEPKKRGGLRGLFRRKSKEAKEPEKPKEKVKEPQEEAPPTRDYSSAPGSLRVRIPGVWKVSRKIWVGVVDGTLTGADVVSFLMALDDGDEHAAVQLVCDAYGDDFGAMVDLDGSSWDGIVY